MVFQLYAFVRTVDDFVDCVPQQTTLFYKFCVAYAELSGQQVSQVARAKRLFPELVSGNSFTKLSEEYKDVLQAFVSLKNQVQLDERWIQAFLSAMEADLYKSQYQTLAETRAYMFGSAEVVGLCMAQILQLPKQAYPSARLLGRAMQYINFLRDVGEDLDLGRQYLPHSTVAAHGLARLSREEIAANPDRYTQLIRHESCRYLQWQRRAEEGYKWIPIRYLLPIQTASDMYVWTIHQVAADPLKALQASIKPTKKQVILRVLKNSIKTPILKLRNRVYA